MRKNRWEHFSHDADVGIRGYGSTPAEAFAMAATAMTGIITDLNQIRALKSIPITCSALDLEILLVDWLNAIIYEMDVRQMLFSEFAVTIQDLCLKAIIKGESIDPDRHQPAVGIKGATYTELKVYQRDELWVAQCVLDV